ncbi:hypothetical protein PFLUV_G00114040 [Perca fluviatilis]|uniref:Uncharacterized protein n=1 Tax=Perca fluviatilis TaxID=8168 RepID=A0A6A5EZ35_PERFL|nr:hypothetical protein PFLUV_G00114040 [Perca fluviatilis]
MPFDTKSHLINYRTEGQGENMEVPLLDVPTQIDGNMVNVNMGMANNTLAMVPMAGLDFQRSITSMDGMNRAGYQEVFSIGHRERGMGVMNQQGGRDFYSGVGGGMYDGIALPDHFLAQYYTQKVASGNDNQQGLVYDYDLHFLDDLRTKFKTEPSRAEPSRVEKVPCSGKTP